MLRLLLLALPMTIAPLAHAADATRLDPVVVTATRDAQPVTHTLYSVTRLDGEDIDAIGALHPNELFARVPGAWISRGSGQEHLTAIRSPVLSGAGACGAFLFLEDGIPVRPTGFCNVNQLFEINTEQADAIEVLRGPGSVLYGSNALHGVVNVLHAPLRLPLHEVSVAVGEYGHRRLAFDVGELVWDTSLRAKYFGETSNGIQHDAGHDQHKLNLGFSTGNWRAHLAATRLDQDTAGYILGEDAYRDPDLRRANFDPDAYRKAESLRAWAVWQRELRDNRRIELRPYARYSDMDFLQHFLPGMPLEENGQTSAGLIATYFIEGLSADWTFGTDMEWADGWLRETQHEPVDDAASEFLRETRPLGRHYDYTVIQSSLSPWLNVEYRLNAATALIAGARADWLRYDYDNHMRDGNRREDGSECAFGGCIYNRPADGADDFFTVSPKLGIRHHLGGHATLYANAVRGFRVPQATELYRLQRGQDVADLDPVQVDSLEAGLRAARGAFDYDLALFVMEKRNDIYRDAEGFNVSNGRTRHRGIEFDLGWRANASLAFAVRGSYARHEYAFDYRPSEGEQFADGNDVDTAPRVLGSATAQWTPTRDSRFELEYVHTGAYYIDAENTRRYPGHGLWHARWQQAFDDFTLNVRVLNLLDEEYAERADFAFGEYRYFPGWPRRVNVELAYAF